MNNLPVFPSEYSLPENQGMTLRDYFATKAMQVILQSQYQDGIYVNDIDNDSEIDCAESAYILADAMMRVRLT